jgi:hypothetical protein
VCWRRAYFAGNIAIARNGAPLPPLIFIGNAMMVAPTGGSLSSASRFSSPGMFAAYRIRCVSYVVDCPQSMLAVSMPSA